MRVFHNSQPSLDHAHAGSGPFPHIRVDDNDELKMLVRRLRRHTLDTRRHEINGLATEATRSPTCRDDDADQWGVPQSGPNVVRPPVTRRLCARLEPTSLEMVVQSPTTRLRVRRLW